MQQKFVKASIWIGIYYGMLGTSYWLLLHFTYGAYRNLDEGMHTFIGFSIRFALSIVIYWVIFIRLRHWKLLLRVGIHLIALLLFLWLGFNLFHTICDFFSVNYLTGRYAIWDIYIPMIMYIGLFATLHSYEYFVLFKNQRIREATLQIEILKTKLDSLKSRIQPHYLYNALNSISATLQVDQEETKEALAQLADTFRFILDSSEQELISIEQELRFIQNYLAIEQRRFIGQLSVHFKINDQVHQYAIPTMILQPLIENVTIHSISSDIKSVNLYVSIDLIGDKIVYNICDDGVGSPIVPKDILLRKGTGLKNVNQRLWLYYKTGLTITANTPSGFCVSFSTPAVKYAIP